MSQYKTGQDTFDVCSFLTYITLFVVALGCSVAEGKILGQPGIDG